MANTSFASNLCLNSTLSGSNLIATGTGSGGATAADGKASGKYYIEYTCTTIANSNTGVGVCSLMNYTDMQGSGSRSAICFRSGNTYILGSNRFSVGTTFTNGTLVCVAVDLDNKRIWFRKGTSGNWNGNAANDPTSSSTGYDISTWVNAGFLIHPSVTIGATSDAITANFGDTGFSGTVPTGYTSGWPTSSYTSSYATLNLPGTSAVALDGVVTGVAPTQGGTNATGLQSGGGKRYGKWYFEYRVDPGLSGLTAMMQAGVCSVKGPTYATEYTNETHVCAVTAAGNIYNQSNSGPTQLNGGSVVAAGTVFACAFDLDNRRAWFKSSTTSNTNWNANGSADPASNVGGINISGLAGSVYATIWMRDRMAGRINFGDSSFVYTPPAGFNAWTDTDQGVAYQSTAWMLA